MPETINRMNALLSSWNARDDRRRIFLDCYSRMTRHMLDAVENGDFQDGRWVTDLLHHFAGYYFDALDGFERRDSSVPAVWVHAFTAAASPSTTALQNLMLGVNAHINFDLVFALSDILTNERHQAESALLDLRYSDHCLVNGVIARTVDEVQDEVIEPESPMLDVVDKLGGHADEWATSWMIARWRDKVWKRAIAVTGCTTVAEKQERRKEVEIAAFERARLLLLV